MFEIRAKGIISALRSGTNNLINNAQLIDSLNVFPVPDGDTGSNMASTLKYAINNVDIFSNDVSEVLKQFSKGMLLGARGNSGVIFSQIIKGFSLVIANDKVVSPKQLLSAFSQASKQAYKSVIKPVEGTILTVIRETAEGLEKKVNAQTTIEQFFKHVVELSTASLNNTPNLLPILKEVGVVDSGGKGLVIFFEGILSDISNKPIEVKQTNETVSSFAMKKEIFNGEFGFCTEFIINLKHPNSKVTRTFDKELYIQTLKKMGATSEVVVQDEDILKVHCHIEKPVKILDHSQKFGEFIKVKVENMNDQASGHSANPNNHPKTLTEKIRESSIRDAKIGIISCNNGQGIINDLKQYGVDFVIEGGQTMNPSAGDFVEAINKLPQKEIIILPNNSNIIMAAKQATKATKKKVVVLHSKTQVQGIAAMIQFNSEDSLKENIGAMEEAIEETIPIAITRAIKTTKIDKVKIKEGDYLGIRETKILFTDPSRMNVAVKTILKLINELSEIVTIYVGTPGTFADAKEIASIVESKSDVEVVVKEGGQPTYDFLISVE